MQKWGFWIDAFSAICQPDNMAFCVSPVDYIESCEKMPREMAILRAVQDAMRSKMNEKMKEGRRAGAK